jgi:hypothetical protein
MIGDSGSDGDGCLHSAPDRPLATDNVVAGARTYASSSPPAGAPTSATLPAPAPQAPTVGLALFPPPPSNQLADRVLRSAPRTTLHVPGSCIPLWAGLLLRWLQELALAQRDALSGAAPLPAHPSISVGTALVLALPLTAHLMRPRVALAEVGDWVALERLVAAQQRASRPPAGAGRSAGDRVSLKRKQQKRARLLFAEGAVTRAIRTLSGDPAVAAAAAADVAGTHALLVAKFPPEHGASRAPASPAAPSDAAADLSRAVGLPARRARHDPSLPPPPAVPGPSSPTPSSRPPARVTAPSPASRVRRAVLSKAASVAAASRAAQGAATVPGAEPWRAAVSSALASSGRVCQPGPSGLRPEHVREAIAHRPHSEELKRTLDEVVDLLCAGAVPLCVTDTRAFAIPKPLGGVRPIGVPEVLRAVAARIGAVILRDELEAADSEAGQLGASASGSARAAARIHAMAQSGSHVLSLDLENAFNSMSRRGVLCTVDPNSAAAPLIAALYGGTPLMQVPGAADHSPHLPPVPCESGVIQGCPLAAILFAHAIITGPIRRAREDAARLGVTVRPAPPAPLPSDPDYTVPASYTDRQDDFVFDVWYADDGHLVGSPAGLDVYGSALEARFCEVGLRIAVGPTKTAMLVPIGGAPPGPWATGKAALPDVLRSLGVPCGRRGEDRHAAAAVAARIDEIVAATMVAAEASDPQDTLTATRVAGSLPRSQYLLTSVAGAFYEVGYLERLDAADLYCAWAALRELRDGLDVRAALSGNVTRTARMTAMQCVLPLDDGGIGSRSCQSDMPGLRAAAAAAVAAADSGDKHASSRARREAQAARAAADATRSRLLSDLASPSERARLLELAAVAAGGTGNTASSWLTGPINLCNHNLITNPEAASIALAYRLGLPVLPPTLPPAGAVCPPAHCSTKGVVDPLGHHTLGCSYVTNRRHNGARDAAHKVLCGDGGLQDVSSALVRGGLARSGVAHEVVVGHGGYPVKSSGLRDGDLAVFIDDYWHYADFCGQSHTARILAGACGAAVNGAAAAGAAWLTKNARKPAVELRNARIAPIGFGAYGHVDSRSAAFLHKCATLADDRDPIAPSGPQMGRPKSIVTAVVTAAMAETAAGVMELRSHLRLPQHLPRYLPSRHHPDDSAAHTVLQALQAIVHSAHYTMAAAASAA